MLRALLRGCLLMTMTAWGPVALAQGGDSCASPESVVATSAITVVSMSTATPVSSEGHHASCDMKSGSTWYNSVDVWYDYQAFGTGLVTVTFSNCVINSNSATASNLSQWTSCAAPDAAFCHRGTSTCGSSLSFPITAGQHYLVRAATFALSSSGSSAPRRGTATVTFTEQNAPSNETCATALDQNGPGTVNWNDTLAVADGPLPPCTSEAAQKDLWYRYNPVVAAGIAVINSNVSTALISVHDDACPPTTTYACASGSVSIPLTPGAHYRVRVARPVGAPSGGATLGFTEYPAPDNETCNTAQEVVAGEYAWNDGGAVADGPFTSCGLAATATQRDVWFAYTAAVDGTASVDCRVSTSAVPGNNNSATIGVFNACDGAEITCASNAAAKRWVCFSVTSGQRYLVRLGRASTAARESWTLRIREFATPAGDTWQTATPLTLGSVTYSNLAACDVNEFESSVNCYGVSSPGSGAWFYLDSPDNGVASFDTSAATSVDTVLVAYGSDASGNCNGQVLTCSNDLALGTLGSYISLPVQLGTRIYLRADIRPTGNSNGYYGNFTMTTDVAPPYAHDECAGARTLTTTGDTFDNRAATDSPGVPDPSCNNSGNLGLTRHDLWWKWTPTQNGTTRISTCRVPGPLISADLTLLTVYSDCTLAQEVACNDDAGFPDASDFAWASPCTDEQSALHFSSRAYTTYLIRVGAHRESFGPGVLNLSFVPNPCTADFDNSGAVQVQDIFDFLNAWFGGSPAADFNGGGLSVADIFDFLNAWFLGC